MELDRDPRYGTEKYPWTLEDLTIWARYEGQTIDEDILPADKEMLLSLLSPLLASKKHNEPKITRFQECCKAAFGNSSDLLMCCVRIKLFYYVRTTSVMEMRPCTTLADLIEFLDGFISSAVRKGKDPRKYIEEKVHEVFFDDVDKEQSANDEPSVRHASDFTAFLLATDTFPCREKTLARLFFDTNQMEEIAAMEAIWRDGADEIADGTFANLVNLVNGELESACIPWRLSRKKGIVRKLPR